MTKETLPKKTYLWVGIDKSGKNVSDSIDVCDIKSAKLILKRQGITIQRIKKKPSPLLRRFSNINNKDIVFMSRQLATLLSSGIPLNQALLSIAKIAKHPAYKQLLDTIRQDIEQGISFSNALKKYAKFFSPLYVNMVAIGEETGTLDVLMGKIASNLEKTQQLKNKITSLMFYPVLIICISMTVITIILLLVIPEFQKLYQQQGAQLPSITMLLINLSSWLKQNIISIVAVIVIMVLLFIKTLRSSNWLQHRVDYLLLRIPFLGKMIEYVVVTRITHALAIMLVAGIPLTTCLNITRRIANNKVYENDIENLQQQVIAGQSLTESMSGSRFPSLMIQMTATGEATGALDTMIKSVSQFYEAELEYAITVMTSLIEPILIVTIGSIIGIILVAMYMPMLTLGAIF